MGFVNIHSVIFDLDNCLIRSTIDYKKIKQYLLEMTFKLTEASTRPSELLSGPFDIQSLSISELLSQIKELSPRQYDVAMRVIEEEEMAGSLNARPMPCARELLELFYGTQVKIGLLTNNNRQITDMVLSRLEWTHFFDLVLTREDVRKMKPAPDGLLLFLERWRCKPQQVLYIGDSWIDETAALEANVYFIGIRREWQPGSYHSKCELRNEKQWKRTRWLNHLCQIKSFIVLNGSRIYINWEGS